jgi:hypothetical protein
MATLLTSPKDHLLAASRSSARSSLPYSYLALSSLYIFVHNPYALLGMLGGLAVLFAVCDGWLAIAKRDQTFAATGIYEFVAAVLVVFVSGTFGGTPNSKALATCNCTQV